MVQTEYPKGQTQTEVVHTRKGLSRRQHGGSKNTRTTDHICIFYRSFTDDLPTSGDVRTQDAGQRREDIVSIPRKFTGGGGNVFYFQELGLCTIRVLFIPYLLLYRLVFRFLFLSFSDSNNLVSTSLIFVTQIKQLNLYPNKSNRDYREILSLLLEIDTGQRYLGQIK